MRKTILLLSIFFVFNTLGQNQKIEQKGVIYLQYDSKLLTRYQHPIDKYFYYFIEKSRKSEGSFWLEEKAINVITQPTQYKVNNLEEVIKRSKSYWKGVIVGFELYEYLTANYNKIYLIKDDNIIEVEPMYAIE